MKPIPKKRKGSLNTVQYGLRHHKKICTYECHEENCTFTGRSLCELNVHHIDLHGEVQCTGCDKMFKTPSSMKHHDLHMFVMYGMKDLHLKVNSSFTVWCTVQYIHFIAWLRTVENPISHQMNLINMPRNTLVLLGIVMSATTARMTDGT